MADPHTQDSRRATEADARAPDGVLAFIANFLAAFTHVDPRVITREERHSGRTALGF